MKHEASASTRLKALVVARLMMGDIDSWEHYLSEIETTSRIQNRRTARSVMSQISFSYKKTSQNVLKFIEENFVGIGLEELAQLSESILPGVGLSLRLSEFEATHFGLAPSVKRRFPAHSHLRISLWGMQFEFPEMHFLNDIEAGSIELNQVSALLKPSAAVVGNPKSQQIEVAHLVSRQKLLCRALVSASFSLLEAYLSGLFFIAANESRLGNAATNEDFRGFARSKESAPLKTRLDRVLREASGGHASVDDEPIRGYIDTGKRYRDAIHHTSPFERKDVEAGGRLIALYELDPVIAFTCVEHSLFTVSLLERLIWQDELETDVMQRSRALLNLLPQPFEAPSPTTP